MSPEDIKNLIAHIATTQVEMEICVRDGKCHVGRPMFKSEKFMVMVIDLEGEVHELVYYRDVISIKIITE